MLERRAETFAAERDSARTDLAAREATLAETYGAKDELTEALAAKVMRSPPPMPGSPSWKPGQAGWSRIVAPMPESQKQMRESLRQDIDALRRRKKPSLQGALDQARTERRRLEQEVSRQRKAFEEDLSAQNTLLLTQIDEITQKIMDAQQQAMSARRSKPATATGANGRKGGPAASEQKAPPRKDVGCQIIEYQIVCQQGFRQQDDRTQGECRHHVSCAQNTRRARASRRSGEPDGSKDYAGRKNALIPRLI